MAETEVVAPPPAPTEETFAKDAADKREGKPERPKREQEEVPDMTVEEAQKALNALPKPEPQPDNEEHELQVAAINEDIKKIKSDIEVLKAKIDEANEARRGQGDEMGEARAVMRALKEERDEIRSHLDGMQAESAKAKAALEGHDKSRRALQSSLKFKTVGEIETAIRQMEARQQTSSMSLAEEKKLIKEIEQLKTSKKTAAQFMSTEEAVKGAKDGYGLARKTESEKKAELRAVQEKLKAAFTVLEEMGAKRDEEGGGVNTLFEQKKALHEEINVKIEEIKELRGAHRAKLDQWYNSRRERMKLKRALQKAEWVERMAAKTARTKALEEEEAKKIPYESEMVLCDTLVSYLETSFLKPSTDAPKAAVEAKQAATNAEFSGMKMVMKKRDDEEFIATRGGKKKGGGKKKAGGKNAAGGKNTIVHAIDTMESFSMLSIAPPANKAAVPDAIKALKDKKAWFSEQPRPTTTTAKPAQAGDKSKSKKAPKVKAPDMNDQEFPGLPGMVAKPKSEEAGEGEGGEGADGDANTNGAGEGGADGDDKTEKVAPPTAASIVANGVKANGNTPEAGEDKPAPVEDKDAAKVEAKEDGEEEEKATETAVEGKDGEDGEDAANREGEEKAAEAAEPESEEADKEKEKEKENEDEKKKDEKTVAGGEEESKSKDGGGKEE
eukprot:g11112.t1